MITCRNFFDQRGRFNASFRAHRYHPPPAPGVLPPAANEDPLAQLRDLHLPQAVADWPPALGWWLLAGLVLFGLVWAMRALYRRYKSKAYRRIAQRELKAIAASYAKPRTQGAP